MENLYEALTKAIWEIEAPSKNKTVNYGRTQFKYADLQSVIEAIKPACNKHGLAVLQLCSTQNQCAIVTTRVIHKSGESLETILELPVPKFDPQGVGSALTYAKRYALCGLFCVASDDDDDAQTASPPAFKAATTNLRPNPTARPAQFVFDQTNQKHTAWLGKKIAEAAIKVDASQYEEMAAKLHGKTITPETMGNLWGNTNG